MNKPRLIDANKVIKTIEEVCGGSKELLIQLINEQPTAYDIDKVVEQLEAIQNFEMRTGKGYCPDRDTECRYMYSDLGCSYCAFEKAIEIVKGGAE